MRKYQNSGLSIDKLLSLSEDRIEDMFAGSVTRERVPSARREALEALLPEYAKRLSRKGTLIKTLYEEYSKSHPDGYKHAQFATLLRRYILQIKAVGHVEHPAGDQMYVDFQGIGLKLRTQIPVKYNTPVF